MNNTKSVWLTVKTNVELPQVFTLADGAKLVYFPNGKLDTSKGVKRMPSNSYQVTSPYNGSLEVTNLSDFCRTLFGTTEGTNRAKYVSSFCDMFSGIRKERDVMGWTKQNSKPTLTLVEPLEEDTESMELLAC